VALHAVQDLYLIMQLIHLCDAVAEDQSATLCIVGDTLSVSGFHLSVSGCHNQMSHQHGLLLGCDSEQLHKVRLVRNLIVAARTRKDALDQHAWTVIACTHLHNIWLFTAKNAMQVCRQQQPPACDAAGSSQSID